MEREVKMRPGKKLISKIASVLPWILMYLCIYFFTFAVMHGMTEGIKYEAKAEALAAENEYLKGELEWFKEQLMQKTAVTDALLSGGD
jgi:hypothetical protein